ncbi:MAG: DUF2845 domain-containing protein [Nitrospirae bacterium]|nr:DUF2845 domain-containing protein [Nitrospirota bacterium]
MRSTSVLFCLLAFMAIPCVNAYADSLDCKGGIVSVGDSRVDLMTKCGEPDWKDSHNEEISERLDKDTRNKLIVTVDEWTYNFGPSQFIRIVTMRNGRIADIRTGGYGYNKSTKPE